MLRPFSPILSHTSYLFSIFLLRVSRITTLISVKPRCASSSACSELNMNERIHGSVQCQTQWLSCTLHPAPQSIYRSRLFRVRAGFDIICLKMCLLHYDPTYDNGHLLSDDALCATVGETVHTSWGKLYTWFASMQRKKIATRFAARSPVR